MLAAFEIDQFDLGAGQIAVGREHVEAAAGRVTLTRSSGTSPTSTLIDRTLQLALVDAAAHRGIALGIEIDEQGPLPGSMERSSQVDAGRGLAHAAFLIGNTEDTGHSVRFRSENDQVPFGVETRHRRRCPAAADGIGQAVDLGLRIHAFHGEEASGRPKQVAGRPMNSDSSENAREMTRRKGRRRARSRPAH
jgi:hypothetical protein